MEQYYLCSLLRPCQTSCFYQGFLIEMTAYRQGAMLKKATGGFLYPDGFLHPLRYFCGVWIGYVNFGQVC